MFGRFFWMLVLMAAAFVVPYFSTQWSKLKASFSGSPSSSSYSQPYTTSYSSGNVPQTIWPTDPQREETPLVEMNEAFNLGVTPGWVTQRWPRVTTGVSDGKFQGLRVPLITGMREDDAAGSITYYFTPSQKCAKITFTGSTGDPRRLTALLVERFEFKPVASSQPGAQLYQVRWNGTAYSELTIRPAGVVRSTAPYARYDVQLMASDPSAR